MKTQHSLKQSGQLNYNSKNDIISQMSPSEEYSISPKKIIRNSNKQSDSKIESISLSSSKNQFQNIH